MPVLLMIIMTRSTSNMSNPYSYFLSLESKMFLIDTSYNCIIDIPINSS